MTGWYAGALGALVALMSACGGLGDTGLSSLCGSEEAVVARIKDLESVSRP